MRTFSWLLFVAAACGGAEPENGDPVAYGGAFQCPIAYCGANSATIDHYNFHELNLDGIENDEHFRILGMSSGSEFYDLEVTKSRIFGHDRFRGLLYGPALKDAVIYLEHDSKPQ